MNEKELKELAIKIANLERKLQVETNQDKIREYKTDIELLCMSVHAIEDYWVLDSLIEEILS